MGYRHYFYKADKAEVDKVKDMTYDQLFSYAKEKGCEIYEEENYFDFSDKKFLNQKKFLNLVNYTMRTQTSKFMQQERRCFLKKKFFTDLAITILML